MGLIKKTEFDCVEAVRFGKYNLADNSTAVIYFVGNTLIDTAPPNQKKDVLDFMENKKIEKIILTHHHEDHSGNSAAIAEKLNIPVYIHQDGVEILKKGFKIKPYQKFFWGNPNKAKALPLPEEIDCGNGIKLKPIHTPGHSNDHVCFFEENKKWLFSGDLFISSAPKLFRLDEDLEKEIESLEKILEYDFEVIFCSHRGIMENDHVAMEKKLRYLRNLVEDVKKAREKGISSAKKIRKEVLGKEDMVGFISLKHLSKENLIKECIKVAEKEG